MMDDTFKNFWLGNGHIKRESRVIVINCAPIHVHFLFFFPNRSFETEDLHDVKAIAQQNDNKNTKISQQNQSKFTAKKRQISTQTKIALKPHNPLLDSKKEDVKIEAASMF